MAFRVQMYACAKSARKSKLPTAFDSNPSNSLIDVTEIGSGMFSNYPCQNVHFSGCRSVQQAIDSYCHPQTIYHTLLLPATEIPYSSCNLRTKSDTNTEMSPITAYKSLFEAIVAGVTVTRNTTTNHMLCARMAAGGQ